MTAGRARRFVLLTAALVPAVAHAQHIPAWFAAAVLSPILVIALAIVLGFVVRSWRVGLAHSLLIGVWVALFALASMYVTNDYVIWTPMVLYAAHSVLIVLLLAIGLWRRSRTGLSNPD